MDQFILISTWYLSIIYIFAFYLDQIQINQKRLKNPGTIEELTGRQLYYSFLAGAQKIFENQQLINKINVFPVPDADTGTNLASTLQSIIDSPIPTNNLKNTATAIADAALIGARGNSGIIFAQLLFGFSNEIRVDNKMNVNHFAQAVLVASSKANEAIMNPVEGTMITVIRDWAEYVYLLKDKITDFKNLITESYQKAKQSLAETTEKLEVLKKNNVVDAGAKGFVLFLEGMIEFFVDGEIKKLIQRTKIEQIDEVKLVNHKNFNYRYCTEALMECTNGSKSLIQDMLMNYGDSVVIAGSDVKLRFHVHTDEPAFLFEKLSSYGFVYNQKVDDMVFQDAVAHQRRNAIALLTDSSADLPASFKHEKQLHVVPINLQFGKTQYLDRLTISADRFYDMLDNSPDYPTTSQPSKKEFSNRYNYLSTHYDSIIAINLAGGLSGTYNSSITAAQEVTFNTGKKISVVDSKSISAGLGLLLMRANEAIESGVEHGDTVRLIEEWVPKVKLYVNVKTLKYFVKGGRVSPMKGLVAKALNLKPILTVNGEGKAEMFKKSFSRKASINQVLRLLEEHLKTERVWNYAVIYSNKEEAVTARNYAEKLEKIIGKPPSFIENISPVIGVHAGRGTIGVAVMFE